jgi:hypothetical protein
MLILKSVGNYPMWLACQKGAHDRQRYPTWPRLRKGNLAIAFGPITVSQRRRLEHANSLQ